METMMMALTVAASPLMTAGCCLGWNEWCAPEGSTTKRAAIALYVTGLICLLIGGGWAGFFDELGLYGGLRLTMGECLMAALLAAVAAAITAAVLKRLQLSVFEAPTTIRYRCYNDGGNTSDGDDRIPRYPRPLRLVSYEEIRRSARAIWGEDWGED